MKNKKILKFGEIPKLVLYEEKNYFGNGLFQSSVEVCNSKNKPILELEGGCEKMPKFDGLYRFRKISHVFEVFENGFIVNEICENILKKFLSGESTAKVEILKTATAYDYSGNALATLPNRLKLSNKDINDIIDTQIKERKEKNL